MFEGIKNFFGLFDISPVYPIIILAGLVILCFIPHEPVAKIVKKKNSKGEIVTTIYKYRK